MFQQRSVSCYSCLVLYLHGRNNISTVTLQYPVLDSNATEECNDAGEQECIFYLSNNYFPAVGHSLFTK